MKKKIAQDPKEKPIAVEAPGTEQLLEHHLAKSDQNAGKTHSLLENHLENGEKNSKIAHLLAENHLEMQAKTKESIDNLPSKMADAFSEAKKPLHPLMAFIEAMRGDKGDSGEKGEKGEVPVKGQDYFTDDEIEEVAKRASAHVPQGERGEDGISVQGEQGMQGERGEKGDKGDPGNDGEGEKIDYSKIWDYVLANLDKLPKPTEGEKQKPISIKDLIVAIRSLPDDEKISYNDLKDAPKFPRLAGTGYLREISDVNTTGLADGMVLVWSAATQKWIAAAQSGGGGTNILPLNNTFTGQNTFSSSLAQLVKNLEGVLYADQFAGADIGAKINAAYAALPSTGGTIIVGTGQYSFSTPILCNTLNKPVLLKGDPAGACTLTYTGGTTTVACTINVTAAVTPGYGIQGLKFVGPNSKGSTVGIQLGGMGANDSKGFAGGTLRDVHVRGFGCNILIGNNAFIVTLDNVISNFGGVLLFEKGGAGAGATDWTVNGANTINSGERMVAMNCTFADADNTLFGESSARYAVHLQVSGLTDWDFISTSFDDCELYVDYSGGTGNQVHLTDCHFENPAGDSIAVYTFITTLSAAASTELDLTDTTFVQDANVSAAPSFISAGCQVSAKGCSLTRNVGASAATLGAFVKFLNADATNNLKFSGIGNFSNAATNMATNGTNVLAMTGGTGVVNGLMVFSYINGGGVLKSQNFNTIYDASQFPGSDIGAQINNAYAAAVAASVKGCIITLPAGAFSFSTPINIGTDGVRASIRGCPGDGTMLTYTGANSTKAITINCGYQGDGAGSEHITYEALVDITLDGQDPTSANAKIGVYFGGANGAAGANTRNLKIEGFGQGFYSGANTYHSSHYNMEIRHCAQLMFIAAASNSGEAIHFFGGFFVDPFDVTYVTANGVQLDNSAVSSLLFSGCSFDDTQVRIMQANNVVFQGCHFENPGSANWGAYVYVQIDQNPATNVSFNGDTFFATGVTSPTNYINSGGTVTLNGIIVRKFTGSTMTNFAVLTGSGVLQWTNMNNVSGAAVTNVVTGIPFVSNGWTDSTGAFATMSKSGVLVDREMTVSVSSTYPILTTDKNIFCNGTFTVTLPTTVSWSGKPYVIKNIGTGVITIATTSSQTIDGATTQTIGSQYQSVSVISDGANWNIT